MGYTASCLQMKVAGMQGERRTNRLSCDVEVNWPGCSPAFLASECMRRLCGRFLAARPTCKDSVLHLPRIRSVQFILPRRAGAFLVPLCNLPSKDRCSYGCRAENRDGGSQPAAFEH
jgi:hypothetical protein